MDVADKHLRIGFDAKRVTRNATGLGNYSRFLLRSLVGICPSCELHLYSYDRGDEGLYRDLLESSCVHPHFDSGSYAHRLPLRSAYYRNCVVPRMLERDSIDLFHGLSNELPFGIRSCGIPSVVTVHDLIYEKFPRTYTPLDVLLYRHKYRRSCEDATHIVAVSERTKADLVEIYGISPSKVTVLYQGCRDIFRRSLSPEEVHAVRTKHALDFRYILCVGTIERRKNAELIVRALALMDMPELHLVLIGRATEYAQKVKSLAIELGLGDRLHLLSGVPDEDLPALYSAAEVFVYPSLYEGFGIPVLEAITVGVPTIAASGSCLEEAGGAHTLYCDPYDPYSLVGHLQTILSGPEHADRMRECGRVYSRRFDPARLASELYALYCTLLGRKYGD